MGLILYIILSPMAGYFIMLIWAAAIGNVCDTFSENTMLEEWLICIQIYIFIVVLQAFRKKVNKNND